MSRWLVESDWRERTCCHGWVSNGCIPTPPARTGRGVLLVEEHPGFHGRMVDSSVAGGATGMEGLGLRDMQSMLQSMAASMEHMDSLTSSSHARTLQIQQSMGTGYGILVRFKKSVQVRSTTKTPNALKTAVVIAHNS